MVTEGFTEMLLQSRLGFIPHGQGGEEKLCRVKSRSSVRAAAHTGLLLMKHGPEDLSSAT